MANIFRLGRGAVRKVNAHVDQIFSAAKARLLGPYGAKEIRVHYTRELSLPGLFEAGAMEEGVRPDLDVLKSLLDIAGGYIDAVQERTKARIVNEINSVLGQARHGGLSRDDYNDLLKMKLSEVFGDVTQHIHAIVDTEATRVKNISVLDGIIGSNLSSDVSDPVVFFVVVRDGDLCGECKRLHLMPDGITPRLWYLSECGHGYHKKGESDPKIGGLHPHCRCTLVTLMPGFGFSSEGKIMFIKRGHLELPVQRGLGLSEAAWNGEEPLSKTEKFDPKDHPRNPETGEFVDHEGAMRSAILSRITGRRHYANATPEQWQRLFEHSRQVFAAAKRSHPDLYRELLAKPWMAELVAMHGGEIVSGGMEEPGEGIGDPPLDPTSNPQQEAVDFARQAIELGHLAKTAGDVQSFLSSYIIGKDSSGRPVSAWPEDLAGQVSILKSLGVRHLGLAKGALRLEGGPSLWSTPYASRKFTDRAVELHRTILEGHKKDPRIWTHKIFQPGFNSLLFAYKYHSNSPSAQLLKYIGHIHQYYDEYLNPDNVEELDQSFDEANNLLRIQRDGFRGPQHRADIKGKTPEISLPPWELRMHLAKNLHLFEAAEDHRKSLQERLAGKGFLKNGVESFIFARAYRHDNPNPNRLLSSFSDKLEGTEMGGKFIKMYAVPRESLFASFHHAGPAAYGHQRRTSENEFLNLPHSEITPTPHEIEAHFHDIIPIEESGAKALDMVPRDPRGKIQRDPPLKTRLPKRTRRPSWGVNFWKEAMAKSEGVIRTAKTQRGTVIKRSKLGVGKDIGGAIYLHRDYENHIPNQEGLLRAKQVLDKNHPGFKYNALKVAKDKFTFFNSPDFDTAHEPVAGNYITVSGDKSKAGNTSQIWHHKWLWVKEGYRGFDVDASHRRSLAWLKIPNIDFARIGNKEFWESKYVPKIPIM